MSRDFPYRKLIRLKNYDYTQCGSYFVTICTELRQCLFGDIVAGEMILNDVGKIVETVLTDLSKHFANVDLGACIIMPNHFHGILHLGTGSINPGTGLVNVGAGSMHAGTGSINRTPTVGEIVRAFKAKCTYLIHKQNRSFKWQRNYYERIIRSEQEYNRIYEYILENPKNWQKDENNLSPPS